jgi:hypothetical protein
VNRREELDKPGWTGAELEQRVKGDVREIWIADGCGQKWR